MKEIISDWNPWWGSEYTFKGVKREKLCDVLPWIKRKEIVSIMGVRRSGKTTFLFEIIDHLLNAGKINPKNILFIKADDDRINPAGLIDNILDEYEKLINPEGKVFVFIDEIQEVIEWQKTLKRMYDLKRNLKFFISGSNASLMKEELSALLAGRCAAFELFPFSFSEFLQAKGLRFRDNITLLQARNRIRHFLVEYLTYGAFPEVALAGNNRIKTELAEFYFDSIFYRDIIRRKNIRNPAKLERLVKYFLQNISNPANFTKIGRIIELTTDSVVEYTRALEDAYLVFAISLLEFSYKKQIINPKKMYCIDTGIRNIAGFRFSDDIGRLYENAVFTSLRRKTREVFYWRGRRECDFIAKTGKNLEAIQVCCDIKGAKEKELQGLLDALQHFGLKEGTIITEDYERNEKTNGKTIHFIPLWKWLLGSALAGKR